MAQIEKIRVMCIHTSPMNPRKTFDEEKLEELAQNIEEQGLLQPITVRKISDEETHIDEETGEVVSVEPRYEIVCGERRFRAWNMLAKKSDKYNEIPCIVREMTDEQAFDAMITENLQRQDVDPVEESIAFSLLLENGNAVEDIAVRFGKSIRFIQDRVKLKGLIPELIDMLRQELIPISGAMLLAKLDIDAQKEFYNENVNGESATSISDIKEYVKYRVMKEADNLVKKGEPLTFGKSVILIESPKSWDNENEKKRKEDAVRMYNDMGFEVVYDNVFDHQCWYNEGDERIAEKLENNELYRCIEVLNYRRPEFKVSFYYLKKSSSVKGACTVSKQIEAENIRQKIKRNKELMVEKATETLRSWANEITDYSSKPDDITLNEQIIFDSLVLEECGYVYLDSIGVSTGENDLVKYVTEHQNDRKIWYREFIRNKLSDSAVMYNRQLQELQNLLFKEQYPEKYEDLCDKLGKSYGKKEEKLNERLKELESEQ